MKIATVALAAMLSVGGSAAYLSAEVVTNMGPPQTVPGAHREFRRKEVLMRLDKQNREILAKERSGAMTYAQGDTLDRADQRIRAEMRRMSAGNGGYLTRSEQRRLDAQLNDNWMAIRGE